MTSICSLPENEERRLSESSPFPKRKDWKMTTFTQASQALATQGPHHTQILGLEKKRGTPY